MHSGLFIAQEVAGVRHLLAPLIDQSDWHQRPVPDQIDAMASALHKAHADGNAAMASVIHCWHPELVCASTPQIMQADLTHEDCRIAVAREHGFNDLDSVTGSHRPAFEQAVDALVHGDGDTLAGLLREEPGLSTATSAFGHRATLLHYVGSNGVETWRQCVPANLLASARLLLEVGADVSAQAGMYGGSTVAELVASTGHLHEAGMRRDLLQVLADAGADCLPPPAAVDGVTPILRCSAMEAALKLYVDELGFRIAWTWGEPIDFACVSLGDAEIFLCKDGQGHNGTWMSLFLDDVDAYRAAVRPSTCTILKEPTDEPWGVRECLIRTHDDHVICFSGPLAGP